MAIGTGAAIESSDVALVRGDLGSVVKALRLSRATTFKKIKQKPVLGIFLQCGHDSGCYVGFVASFAVGSGHGSEFSECGLEFATVAEDAVIGHVFATSPHHVSANSARWNKVWWQNDRDT